MSIQMTIGQAEAWELYRTLAEEMDRQNPRTTPPEVKLRQLATLMHVKRVLHIEDSTEEETQAVRNRWLLLKTIWTERLPGCEALRGPT